MADTDWNDRLRRCRREARRVMPDASQDLVDEVAAHLAERWSQAIAGGASDAAAESAMLDDLARWRSTRGAHRSSAWRRACTGWAAELRQSVRALGVRPIHTASQAALTGLAIGAVTAAFAVAYGLLWRPLPYPDGDRLAVLWQVERGEATQISYPDYADLTAGALFDGATAIGTGRGSLRVGDRIERVNAISVEPRGLELLGATPVLGRSLGADDRGQPNVMISHRLWTTQFGGDPAVIGRTIWLSGNVFTVVGVVAAGVDFELPVGGVFKIEQNDIWQIFNTSEMFATRRDISTYEAVVRLPPGRSIAAAQADVDAIGRRLADTYAATNARRSFRLTALHDEIVAPVSTPLRLAALAAALTMAIALANALALAGIRLSDRRRELALRAALGAGGFRLRRQLLTEYLVTVGIGGALGLWFASAVVTALAGSRALALPRPDALRMDAPVIVFAIGMAAAIVVALMALPSRVAQGLARLGAGDRATAEGRRLRRWLVAGELALALTMATAGALLTMSFGRLMAVDPGFRAEGVVSARVSAYAERHAGLPEVRTFFDRVSAAIGALPGVQAVAAGSSLPLSGQTTGTGVVAEGQAASAPRQGAGWQFVTPGYFAALGMTLRDGRDFSADDAAHGGHVTVLNESLARALFPDGRVVGRRVAAGDGDRTNDWHEVIGVVADVRHLALGTTPQPRMYDLFGEHWGRTLFVVARTGVGEPAAMIDPIRRATAAVDPEAPLFEATTLDELVRRSAAPQRLSATAAIGLAAMALVLALAGVYAVAAASVVERARDIGIRAALGASPTDLLRGVLRESFATASAGAVVGVAGAFLAARLVAAQMFDARAGDAAVVIAGAAVAVIAAAIAATLPSALRAAAADPLAVIKEN